MANMTSLYAWKRISRLSYRAAKVAAVTLSRPVHVYIQSRRTRPSWRPTARGVRAYQRMNTLQICTRYRVFSALYWTISTAHWPMTWLPWMMPLRYRPDWHGQPVLFGKPWPTASWNMRRGLRADERESLPANAFEFVRDAPV